MSATACDTLSTQILPLRAGMLCAAKPHCFPSTHSYCTLYTLWVSASSKLWVFSIVLNFSQVGLHSYVCLHSYNFHCLMDGVSHLNMFQAYQYLSLYMPIGHGLVVLSRESTHIHGHFNYPWIPVEKLEWRDTMNNQRYQISHWKRVTSGGSEWLERVQCTRTGWDEYSKAGRKCRLTVTDIEASTFEGL